MSEAMTANSNQTPSVKIGASPIRPSMRGVIHLGRHGINRLFSLLGVVAAALLIAGPAWADFPTAPAPTGTTTSLQTDHVVTLQSCSSGNLHVVIAFFDDDEATITWSGSWQEFDEDVITDTSIAAGYLVSTGSDSLTVTTGTSVNGAFHSYCITGAHASTAPEGGTAVRVASSVDCDPPALNPTGWDAEDTFWIAAFGANTGIAIDAYPADYTDGTNTQVTAISLASAQRPRNIASEDPGIFDRSSSTVGICNTFAVRPAAASRGSQGPLLGVW